MITKSISAFGALVLSVLSFGQAQYKTSVPEKQKVVEELVYYYEVSSYTPPIPVDVTKTANNSTPEGAAMQLLEAMHSQDFDRWFRLWTPESQQTMKSQYQKNGTSPDVFKNGWSKAFNGRTVTLTKKIESGPYVIVVATLSPTGGAASATPAQPIEMEFVFKQVDGTWMATQDLAADPVLNSWKNPNSVTRRVVRSK
ncbi:MAG TPA: hypothetical protein VHV32_01260 [Candidatus Angelobacter sp.]|jgi:hypothetical protein|nr:hypothetical protein [Candidatus Angelobacter sp.]